MSADVVEKPQPSLAVQAFWLIVARTLGFFFTVALPIVLVRVFSTPQFGLYKQAFVVVNTATMILSFGFAMSAYYYLPRLPEKRGAIVLNIALYHFAIGAVAFCCFALFPEILRLMLGDDHLMSSSALIGAVIWAWIFGMFLENVATANADVTWSTLFIILTQISRTLLLLTAAVWLRSVQGVLWAGLIQGLLQSAALLWYLNKKFPGYFRQFDLSMAVEQFRYSAPFAVYGLMYSVQIDLHNYIASNRFSPAEYAIYAVGTAQLPFSGILRDSVNAVLMPRISRLQLEGRKEEIIHLVMEAWRRLAAAMLPAFALLMVLGQDFITVLYTSRYADSIPIFKLNLVLLLFAVFIADAIMRSHTEKSKFFLALRMVSVALQIPFSLIAIRWYGLIGPVVGVLAASTVERVWTVVMLLRMVGFQRKHLRLLSGVGWFALASTIAGIATAFLLPWIEGLKPIFRLVTGGTFFGLVYVAAILALGILTRAERETVNRYSMRFAGVALLR